ncbi:MAG: dTDP-glucose 4,6-dehydratase [Halanaerobiales bacterium]|nr:dTDP-glucose 4,6-dehydratase [Halanaerobiales bacterium]
MDRRGIAKKILVTGGAGFIGSNFFHYMINKYSDYFFINLDNLTYAGNLENLCDIETRSNYQFIKGDITDSELVNQIVGDGVDYIVNFAAESHVDRSIHNSGLFIKTNVLGTQILLDAARKYEIKKFVQISTDEVYGSLGPTDLFTEETPLAPNNPYSASKASADLLVRAFYKTYGTPINITRCSNNYGPYQFPEKLIPVLITNTLENKDLPIYGDGFNIRDWIHVTDHCHGIDLVLHSGKVGEVYNIGSNNEMTNLEIANIILQELSESKSKICFVKDRLGHDRRYAIDSSKIRKELGWSPKYNFFEGIKKTIQWYKENRNWCNF